MKTFGTVERTGNREWHVKAQPDIAIRIKQVFTRAAYAPRGEIRVHDTTEAARDLEWILGRWPMELTEEDQAYLTARADEDRDREHDVLEILAGNHSVETTRMPAREPRPAQIVAADLGLTTGGTMCTDDVGAGKTMTSLLLLRAADALPALVVVKSNTPLQWVGEIQEVWPDLSVHVLKKGTPYKLTKNGRDPDIIVTNYSKLRGWGDHLAGKIKTVIFDEVQELRRPGSAKYSAAGQIAGPASYRFGISNTPVHNYGDELFHEIEILNPGALGTWPEFIKEWCSGTTSTGRHIVADPKALGAWMRDKGILISRTLEEMGLAPPHKAVSIPYQVDTDLEEFDRMSASAVDLARLIVARNAPKKEVWRASGQYEGQMRQATGLAKAEMVAQFVRMIVESHGPVVLFGWHRAVYDRWLALLADLNPLMITGSETPARKHKNKMSFINGESRVLIVSLASGDGMDGMQGICDRVVFGELDWSPSVHKQAIGRLYRPGQQKQVFAYFLYTAVGSDPRMMDVLDVKRLQNDQVVNPDEELFTPATNGASRIRELAEEFLASRSEKEPTDPTETDLNKLRGEAFHAFEVLCGLLNDIENAGGDVNWELPVTEYRAEYSSASWEIKTVQAYMAATGISESELDHHFNGESEAA